MDINATLAAMTLQDKLRFLTGADAWHTVGFETPRVPQVRVSDGPHGLRRVYETDAGERTQPAVCFPTASAAAATWNPETVFRIGQALAGECIDQGVDILLGPGVNMKRSPLCGRNFEYYSEDPCLAGKMGAAYVKGIQSRGVGACLKHFAGNSQETDRLYSSSEMDERTLREIYLKAFETVVKEAKPWSVMCAYNRLNGVHCSQNPVLLDEILRKEWGFDGAVISDWGAVHDRVASLKASLELEMPYSEKSLPTLEAAYAEGTITDAEIDRAVHKLLELVQKVEQAKPLHGQQADTVDERLALAREAAAEAVTLLKNENGVLPIREAEVNRIAVIGGCVQAPFIQGGGSARIAPVKTETPLDAIRAIAGEKVDYAEGYAWHENDSRPEIVRRGEALNAAAAADAAFVFVGENERVETEGSDRSSIRLHPNLEQLILDVAHVNPHTVVVIQAGSAIDMRAWVGAVEGVVFGWYTGSCGGSALADILFGRVNPSGKLPETFPLALEDTPAFGAYPATPVAWYGEGGLIGYRYYDTLRKDVLFPFGYGLSYTTFGYSSLELSTDRLTEQEPLRVSFQLTNTGTLAGKETVQLYARQIASTVRRPEKELKRFQKIELQPGETKCVQFSLTPEDFAFYSPISRQWATEEGRYQILIGASSRDIRLSANLSSGGDAPQQ